MMKRRKREPRPPTTPGLPLTYADAEEAQIIETVDYWFGLMDNRLRRTSRGPQRERAVARLWDVGPPRPVVYFVRACATLYAAGEFDLQQAVDALQAAAIATRLVADIGQDQCQQIIAEAFHKVRQ